MLEYGEQSPRTQQAGRLCHSDLIYVILGTEVPDWSSVLQLGMDNALICSFPEIWIFSFQISLQESQGLVGCTYDLGDIGLPGNVI